MRPAFVFPKRLFLGDDVGAGAGIGAGGTLGPAIAESGTAVALAVLVRPLHLQAVYAQGTEPLVLLLAPAVVALALPLYR